MPEQTLTDRTPDPVPDVRKSVVVPATAEHCFEVFTERALDWWPPTHILVRKERVALVFERAAGGRYFERDVDGNEVSWGRILVWEPPYRLTMTWRIDGRWQPIDDDDRASEIEVVFTPAGDASTLVELAHVKLHRHGEGAAAIHRALDGPSPGETLERFAKAI